MGYTRGRRASPGDASATRPVNARRPRAHLPSDRFGDELAPDAPIWKMYLEEAQVQDRELVEGHKQNLDSLLLFVSR